MKKRIAILGGGESGIGAALLAMAKGMDVFVSDKGRIEQKYKYELEENGIRYEEGQHTEALITNADIIVKSPGIPDKAELILILKQKQKEIISEIEFASEYTKAKFIGITGSNGKTTTTLLTYHLLKKSGLKVGLAGNVGYSLARQVIEDKFEYYVLELSSFQLDGVYKFKAHLAVLLNITPDHLDRYEYKFENYVESKFRIGRNQSSDEYFIYNADDSVITERLNKRESASQLLGISLNKEVKNGAYKADQTLMFNVSGKVKASFQIDIDELPLKGRHNMINTMAALLAGAALGMDTSGFVEAIKDFKNVPHRLEDAGTINQIRFVNDSKATNVDSVWYALDSFSSPLVWIAGGVDKGNDYTQIEELVVNKVKALVCLGKDNSKLKAFFEGKVRSIIDTNSIKDAIQAAMKEAESGDVILLSPACASFDLFKNYEDRGDQFKTEVKKLMSKHNSN